MIATGFELQHRSTTEIVLSSQDRLLRIRFLDGGIVRVSYTAADRTFRNSQSRIIVGELASVPLDLDETPAAFLLSTAQLRVEVNKASGALSYFTTDGKLLTQEPARGGKSLTPRPVTRNIFDRDTEVETGQSIDGARAVATKYTTQFDRTAFEAKLEFVFQDDEALFGLGSHEEGYANLRGRSRELYQQNMKAVVPHLVSTRGYGVLLDCSSLMTFHDDALGSYWWADCVDELDFYVLTGASFDELIRSYRRLTGPPPLPPKWAFGYVQSKERYVTASEMLDVVREYRRRAVPLDTVVLDWKSWPNGAGWGQKSLDPTRFPDPKAFLDELHEVGAKLMVSIWPIMTGACPDQRELLDRDLMLGNRSTYNAFNPEARTCYWQQAERGLFRFGVDAWWCDCTEPFEADWSGAVKPEPHIRLAINTNESKLYLDAAEINAYSLVHAQGLYEGQRTSTDAKRVLNLTRSSYAGQSRYGTITWNGDVSATWETLRRSIAEGLNFCATGEPYWTVDAGGFFVDHNPKLWFWRGDYPEGTRGLTDMDALAPDPADTGSRDLGFWELYTRWLQYAVFLPMFRSHGTDVAREIWRFGEEGNPFYDAIADAIRLRYKLLPYLYSTAAQVTFAGASFVTALALRFPNDLRTHTIGDQYMFGTSLMVCPVAEPMLYGPASHALNGAKHTRQVYLPCGLGWYDFWTDEHFNGGTILEAAAPLDRIPVFARSGSIVVLTKTMQFVDQLPDAPYDITVYAGDNAEFTLYEDAGDGYAYEQGEFARTHLRWDEKREELSLSAREGDFPSMVTSRTFRTCVINGATKRTHTFVYNGTGHRVSFAAGEHTA